MDSSFIINYVCTLKLVYIQNFLHVACRQGSVETLNHIIHHPPPLIPDDLKQLFMATDEV